MIAFYLFPEFIFKLIEEEQGEMILHNLSGSQVATYHGLLEKERNLSQFQLGILVEPLMYMTYMILENLFNFSKSHFLHL